MRPNVKETCLTHLCIYVCMFLGDGVNNPCKDKDKGLKNQMNFQIFNHSNGNISQKWLIVKQHSEIWGFSFYCVSHSCICSTWFNFCGCSFNLQSVVELKQRWGTWGAAEGTAPWSSQVSSPGSAVQTQSASSQWFCAAGLETAEAYVQLRVTHTWTVRNVGVKGCRKQLGHHL